MFFKTKDGNKYFIFQESILKIDTGFNNLKNLLKQISKMVRYISNCARNIKYHSKYVIQELQEDKDSSASQTLAEVQENYA